MVFNIFWNNGSMGLTMRKYFIGCKFREKQPIKMHKVGLGLKDKCIHTNLNPLPLDGTWLISLDVRGGGGLGQGLGLGRGQGFV